MIAHSMSQKYEFHLATLCDLYLKLEIVYVDRHGILFKKVRTLSFNKKLNKVHKRVKSSMTHR